MARRWKTPEEVAAMSDERYADYVRELVREGEESARQLVYSTDEVLAHLAETRRVRPSERCA
jgi:hypothetical protein